MELFRYSIGRLVLICCFYSGLSQAQVVPITWGPLEAQPGFLLDVLPVKSGDFHTIRYTGGLLGYYKSTDHNQLAFVSQNRIKPITENGIGNIDGATYFAGKLRVFVSDKSNGVMSLFCH